MCQKKREQPVFKSNLENELEKLKKDLDESNSTTSLEYFKSTKYELEQIEISETHTRTWHANDRQKEKQIQDSSSL